MGLFDSEARDKRRLAKIQRGISREETEIRKKQAEHDKRKAFVMKLKDAQKELQRRMAKEKNEKEKKNAAMKKIKDLNKK